MFHFISQFIAIIPHPFNYDRVEVKAVNPSGKEPHYWVDIFKEGELLAMLRFDAFEPWESHEQWKEQEEKDREEGIANLLKQIASYGRIKN
jgi:hypothetical protein